jgi:hypothetical protein
MALSVVLRDPWARKELAQEALKLLGVERDTPGGMLPGPGNLD